MTTAARWLFTWLLLLGICQAVDAPWIKAIDLRSLSLEKADEGLPYRLRGTFIYQDDNNAIFLQDETAGALFWYKDTPDPPLIPGDIVEVSGVTKAGLYLPGLDKATFRVTGHGALPDPIEVSYDDLISGRFHYQWVSAEGIVRSTFTTFSPPTPNSTTGTNRTHIRLAMGSRIVEIQLNEYPEAQSLIDHRIRVTGLASGGINDRHQLNQPYIWPRNAFGIQILEKPTPIEKLETVPASTLLTFRPTERTGHRVKVSGTILAAFPDDRIFLRDGKHALAVRTSNTTLLDPGTIITVLGFPEMEGFTATLDDAEIISSESGPPPKPIPTNLSSLANGSMNHELVKFSATVADSFRTQTGASVQLQHPDIAVRLILPATADIPAPGTQLEVTGICHVETSRAAAYNVRPDSIAIHARTPADIIVTGKPSWWTTTRLTVALCLLAAVVAIATLWIFLLRRQVEKQTDALRERIETEAMMLERQRIAREFHDTLEQELTGLSLQLGAASATSSAAPLSTACHMVSRIQTETRNLLHDLRTPSEQIPDLPTALAQLAARYDGTVGPRVEVHSSTEIPSLPPRTLHHLRMIAAESVTNAVKHAQASLITIDLRHTGGQLILAISDNGKGFDADLETREKPGHFGCMGIRERARKLGAEASWQSRPGQGTTVRLTLSTPNERK
jgi:signal transduction histidine kinase